MTRITRKTGWTRCTGGLLLVVLPVFLGCRGLRSAAPVSIANSSGVKMTIAVAPALNLSGSVDFDPSRFADLMASELSYADGISVIPVSRVLGVLAGDGLDRVGSPTHALELADALGADAILVFAVTEYDPFDPPSIGVSAQLYGRRPRADALTMDPVALSRRMNLASASPDRLSRGLLGTTQRVFDASQGAVVAEIKRFAAARGGDGSPYGWRKFVVSQQHFIRFCCHATIRLLLQERRESDVADDHRDR